MQARTTLVRVQAEIKFVRNISRISADIGHFAVYVQRNLLAVTVGEIRGRYTAKITFKNTNYTFDDGCGEVDFEIEKIKLGATDAEWTAKNQPSVSFPPAPSKSQRTEISNAVIS